MTKHRFESKSAQNFRLPKNYLEPKIHGQNKTPEMFRNDGKIIRNGRTEHGRTHKTPPPMDKLPRFTEDRFSYMLNTETNLKEERI